MDSPVMVLVPLAAGYVLDLLLGDPEWLPHPVVGFGRAIASGERWLNRGSNRRRFWSGAMLATGLVASTYLAAWWLQVALFRLHPGAVLAFATIGVFFCLANRTLITEGRSVFRALEVSLEAGRRRVARIVGRDTAALSEHEVRIATLETMAENLSDGVVAPLCFYAVGGVPAMLAYKMINTLDSTIGHHDARFEWFGKTAARVDDAANFIPARLTALLMVGCTASLRGARSVARYARLHASPNSGYPEAALAGILNLRFGGPHVYDGELVPGGWIGECDRPVRSEEIRTVVRINHAVTLLAVGFVGGVALFLPWAN